MKERLAYLDNLKVLLVVGVITLHTTITYGFDGSWYARVVGGGGRDRRRFPRRRLLSYDGHGTEQRRPSPTDLR